MIFFAFYLVARQRSGKYVPLAETWGRALSWALMLYGVFFTVLLYFNATRGAILGFLGGLILVGLFMTFLSKGRSRKWGSIVLIVLILIPIVFFFVKDTSFAQNTPVLSRFASISVTEQTTESRLTIWSMSYEAWQDRPILGWGMGNFTTVFAEYYKPKLWKQEPWFDRSHNVLFDWLVGAGILGLLAYLSLFVFALWTLWKLYGTHRFGALETSLFLGLLGAYFVHNLFVFDNLISYILFFMVLAYLHAERKGWEHSVEETPLISQPFARQSVIAIVALAMIFSVYSYNIKPIKASAAVINGLQELNLGQLGTENITRSQSAFERAINLKTFLTTETREQLTTKTPEVISKGSLADRSAVSSFVKLAQDQIALQVEEYPRDLRAKTFLATLYIQTGKNHEGRDVAQELVNTAPTRPLFWLILGEAHTRLDQFDEALEAYKTAYVLAPDFPDALQAYAVGLIQAGKGEEAHELLLEAYGTTHPPNAYFVQAFIRAGLLDDALLSARALVEQNPNDIQWRFNLARLYVATYQDAAAIAELQKIGESSPELFAQMETLIGQIRDGSINRNIQ